ncbi:MAG: radical SAM protein [Candidatus Methanoplasma sp.]|jgi:MoaA/NifB/PqqE/SkfB family radical SAM enzyme|nr:radical SAM protein [Candidatus Methanoplasma sp.]
MDSTLTISVDVTRQCNLRCRHCFNYSGDAFFRPELSDAGLEAVAEQVLDTPASSVCLCGGEPLLRKEIVFRMVETMRRGASTVNLTSNGILLDSACAETLKKVGVYNVQISLDGDRVAHNWLRDSANAYDSAISAICNLINAGVQVGVACTPTKKNIGCIPKLIDQLNEIGVTLLRMQPIMVLGRAKMIGSYYLSTEEYLQLSLDLTRKTKKGRMEIEWGDATQHLFYLGSGKRSKILCINAYGDILLSPYVPVSFGNVMNHALSDYIEHGILDVCKNNSVLQRLYEKAGYSLENINYYSGLPELYKEEMLTIDCMDDNVEDSLGKIQVRGASR